MYQITFMGSGTFVKKLSRINDEIIDDIIQSFIETSAPVMIVDYLEDAKRLGINIEEITTVS